MQAGLIAKKIGMSREFNEEGQHIPVTLLQVDHCHVIGHKSVDKHGYNAVVVGSFEAKEKSLSKPQRKTNMYNQRYFKFVKEFRCDNPSELVLGHEIKPSTFKKGEFLDVRSKSKGKGFAGVMKRHNFSGLRASHGVSISHRSHGSTGQCQDPGKVFKGKKMAGQLGNEFVTVQNLMIFKVDDESSLIYVKGSVPGPQGSYVQLKLSCKKNGKSHD